MSIDAHPPAPARPFSAVLITGASSGLGAALARGCAGPGVRLHLGARHAERLALVAAECRSRGAAVEARLVDVTDAAAMRQWIGAAGRLDLVIANAGVAHGLRDGAPEAADQTRDTFATNLDGVLNTVLPALQAMATQPHGADGWRGRVAVIASVAAFAAVPSAPAYGAAKAAIDSWTVAAGAAQRRAGILMTSVCPGVIRTSMAAGGSRLPGAMEPDAAAARILAAVAAGRRRLVFPRWLGLAVRLAGLLPPGLAFALRERLRLRPPAPQPVPAPPGPVARRPWADGFGSR